LSTKTLLDELRAFVDKEYEANFAKLHDIWEKPLNQKLESGETQSLTAIKIEDSKHVVVQLGNNDSRFREGDMICLHLGDPQNDSFVRQAMIEAENEGEWLLRAKLEESKVKQISGVFYADMDTMDLKPFYNQALNDVASSTNGRKILLPLLSGELNSSGVYDANYDDAADAAEASGFNDNQSHAVGLGVAAKYLACIQGPPGTGKTRVISLIAKLLVNEGQRVFLSSHTHMAINNALNKIAQEAVPTIKVGASGTGKGLDKNIPLFAHGGDWQGRPDSGYVIGATPFATCSKRLENFDFDTVIFDEASQITVALALMAMRKAKRFVFVGDHKQLPPVVLSKSVLEESSYSIFSRLVLGNTDTVMLNQTYRMNQSLAKWPSKQYYGGELVSAGKNSGKTLQLANTTKAFTKLWSGEHPFVFIPSPGVNTRTQSKVEAELVVELIQAITEAGLTLKQLAVVTPYRNHAKLIKSKLADRFGTFTAKQITIDTVERMQGQEREVIIISMCSTDPQFIQAVAGFFFQAERLNVAITRSMVKLILIGPEIPPGFKVDSQLESLQANINAYLDLVNNAVKFDAQGELYG